MKKIKCPLCSSKKVTSEKKREEAKVPFADPEFYKAVVYTCLVCKHSGDFSKKNSKNFLRAENKAIKNSIKNILKYFADNEITMAHFERVLSLPQRTMARWKKGEIAASSLALLRIVRVLPWILKIADEQFNETVIKEELKHQASILAQPVASLSYLPKNRTKEIQVTMNSTTQKLANIQSYFSNSIQTGALT